MKKKAGFKAYIAAPVMTIVLYAIASLVFILAFNDFETVMFFIILAVIFTLFMSLYALLPYKAKNIVRIINIFLISALLFGLASILARQNLQIEGFFFYVLTGTFGGVTVHFLMGKIIGPVFFGRSWCSWGCWTLMVLDLLPFKKSKRWGNHGLKKIKYIHFIASLAIVAVLVFGFNFITHKPDAAPGEPGTLTTLYWFLTGNALYYLAGIILAIIFKDNRAFCKYICPVSVLLKAANIFSVLRIKGTREACTKCNTCVKNCPFNIKIPEYLEQGTRVKSTECVMCMKCIASCPEAVLKASIGFDIVTEEKIKQN